MRILAETNVFERAGDWLRCALHAHSTVSDGDLPPQGSGPPVRDRGFDVLAITDHWRWQPLTTFLRS